MLLQKGLHVSESGLRPEAMRICFVTQLIPYKIFTAEKREFVAIKVTDIMWDMTKRIERNEFL